VRIDVDTPLVLGSASPRRRELVATLGLPLVVCPADVDEATREGEGPHVYLERIVSAKLARVLSIRASERGVGAGGEAVLVADTIVIAPDGAILGKPRTDDEGRAMIAKLAGATHDVCTRFALAPTSPVQAQTVTTRVTFRSLTAGEIAEYVATGEGRDKAGGYALQGRAAAFADRIDGSYANVVGLPLSQVAVAMRALGWLGAR
jgi:septum formation protein